MAARRLPPNARKLLIVAAGVAAVNYVGCSSNLDHPTSGNLMSVDRDAMAPTSGNLVAPPRFDAGPFPTIPDAAADASDADTGDASDASDDADASDAAPHE